MSEKRQQFRQGDLLIEEVDALPKEAIPSDSDILAYGEVTGHAHRIKSRSFKRHNVKDSTDVYFAVETDGVIVHDEHDEIPLTPNRLYRVQRQRQYDPLTSVPKPVAD